MKNKNIKKNNAYADGGKIFDIIGQLAPLLNTIPAVGPAAAPLVSMGASFLGNQARKQSNPQSQQNATGYTNSNAFGYADGGDLSKIANGAYQVNGAPHMTDGNAVNYKGQNINLDYGETLDTNKDRVISDKYFNPETGKKFSDEDKSLKRIRAKSEKSNALSSDPAARGTIDITSKMEDDLFNKQEMIASLLGDRNNNDMKRTQQAQRTPAFGYEEGGQLQPMDKTQDLLNQMREMVQNMNRVKPLDQSTRPEVFPEDVVWRDNNNQPIDNTIPASKEVSTTRQTSRKNNKVAEIQNKLISLGFDNIGKAGVKGDVDGIMGSRTKAALRKAIAAKKIDESYESYLNMPSKQSSNKANKVTENIPNTPYGFTEKIPYNPKNANTGLDQYGIAYDTDKAESVYQLSDGKIVYRAPEYDGTGKNKVHKYLIPKGDGGYSSFNSLAEVKRFDKVKTGVYNKLDQENKNNQERSNYINSDLSVRDNNINNYQSQINKKDQEINSVNQKKLQQQERIKRLLSPMSNSFNSGDGFSAYTQSYKEADDRSIRAKTNVLDARIKAQMQKQENIDRINDNTRNLNNQKRKSHSFAEGGYIDPLQQLGLKPLGQVTPTYDPTLAARSLSSLSPVRTSSTNQPGLSNVSSIVNSIGSGTEAVSNRNNPFNQMTLGEKIGLGSSALSVALKGIESFQPLQKEPYRYNNAGISLNQLDPTAVLNQNQASYTASLNDINNQSTTGSNRQAMLSSLYSNKMKSDSDIMGKYNELNSNNATQYEQRLAQRNAENNAMSYQVDDLNSRNKGARENMRMGLYGDLAMMGMNTSNVINNRMSQQATLAALKKMAPDVYQNLMKTMDANLRKQIGG